jgi:lipoprotein-anchoring transpeptidase ErfK/SrfK
MKKSIVFFLLLLPFFLTVSHVRAAEIYTTGKLITVDLGKQMLYAWDGGKIVNQSKVSTGLPLTPTVKGSFKIYWKRPSQEMKGGSKAYGNYDYKNVPNIMYFFEGYAIHGAYWHNRFGLRASHGCVNTPLNFAKWIYDWAPLGTRVEIY